MRAVEAFGEIRPATTMVEVARLNRCGDADRDGGSSVVG